MQFIVPLGNVAWTRYPESFCGSNSNIILLSHVKSKQTSHCHIKCFCEGGKTLHHDTGQTLIKFRQSTYQSRTRIGQVQNKHRSEWEKCIIFHPHKRFKSERWKCNVFTFTKGFWVSNRNVMPCAIAIEFWVRDRNITVLRSPYREV